MQPHPFDTAIRLTPRAEHTFSGATSPAYANMVGPFGGITAAVMLAAPCRDPRRIGEPLALTVNYAAPVADGGFVVEATPVRTTRTTQHWTMLLRQGDGVAATASAVFAVRRDTWAAHELPMPAVPAADEVPPTLRQAPLAWPERYEFRFVAGPWPELSGTEAGESLTRVWVRDQPPRPLDALSLAAIADVFYPRIFRRRGRFTPIGTVSITTYFHAAAAELAAQGARPVLGCAQGRRYAQGFFEQNAEVWGDAGVLLASSHQIVYFKE